MSEHMSPIPSRVYNAAVGGHVCGPEDVDFGQKVVHLIKYDRAGNEVSFESQVTQANKIYVIHDNFTLSSNVTIPANCVLEFDGGSISGAYTLTGQNTRIEAGLVKVFDIDVTFAGTWVGTFNIAWLGLVENDDTFDNGAIINGIPNVFRDFYIPSATYYFTTPIVFNAHVAKIVCDARLYYNGNSDNASLITLNLLNKSIVYFNSEIRTLGAAFSLVNPISSIIGIDVKDCYNVELHVHMIWNANECIRLISTEAADGGGCAYNTIYPNILCNCNTGIRLATSGNGWVNQNNIFGGRIVCKYGAVTPYNMRRVVVDTNNTINDALTMVGVCMEGSGIGIYAKNLYGSAFVNCRFEGNTWAFYGEGQCRYNKLWSSDATDNNNVNLDNCKNAGIEQGFKPYANFILNDNESITLNRKSGSSRLQLFFQVTELEDSTHCRLTYDKDTDGNVIPASAMNDGTPPLLWTNNRVGYYNTYNAHFCTSIVTVPTNVQEFTLTAKGGKIAVNVMSL